jgi:hypothetical protein
MIRQPDFITEELVEKAKITVREKQGSIVDKVKLETFNEGLSAQILHRGPYGDEGPTIRKLHDFVTENGYILRDDHHEIYLSDPRRSKSENMKTIIRHPIERK